MTFGGWLRRQMGRTGVSVDHLAYNVGVSERTVLSWMYDERHPRLPHLISISRMVGDPDRNPLDEWYVP